MFVVVLIVQSLTIKSSLANSFSIECSMFPKSTHETFAQKLYQTFKAHQRFIKPKLSRTDFTIVHYAGEVISLPLSCNLTIHLEAVLRCFDF